MTTIILYFSMANVTAYLLPHVIHRVHVERPKNAANVAAGVRGSR